jgi:hypothetical protein
MHIDRKQQAIGIRHNVPYVPFVIPWAGLLAALFAYFEDGSFQPNFMFGISKFWKNMATFRRHDPIDTIYPTPSLKAYSTEFSNDAYYAPECSYMIGNVNHHYRR